MVSRLIGQNNTTSDPFVIIINIIDITINITIIGIIIIGIGMIGHLVSRRPKTTLLPILVNAGGFIFSFRLEASLQIIICKMVATRFTNKDKMKKSWTN